MASAADARSAADPRSAPPLAAVRGRFPWRVKASLAREVVSDYVHVRWWFARRGLTGALEELRRSTTSLRDGDALERSEKLLALRLGHVVGRTLGVLPFDSRCLMRSLVLTRMLARRGIHSTLVIGVQVDPKFEAHAWVESFGVPLLPPGDYAERRLVEF